MYQINKFWKNSAIYGVGSILVRAISFFLLPLYTNVFSQTDTGYIFLVFTFIAFAQIIYSYGQDSSFLQYYNPNSIDKDSYGCTSFFLLIFSSFFLSTILFLFSDKIAIIVFNLEKDIWIMYASGILFFDSISTRIMTLIRINERAFFYLLISIINVLISIITSYALVIIYNWGIDGILMGVSLKKTGASGTVKIVNGETPAQRKANLSVAFDKSTSLTDVIYDNGRNYADKDKKYPMDIYIIYGTGAFDKIQLRNFGGNSKGDWKLELKGQYAAMGKIQGSVARNILASTGFTNIPQEPKWEDCHPKKASKTKKEEITKEIHDLLHTFSATGFDKSDEDQMMGEIAAKRQSWRYSKLSGLRFLEYLCKSNVDADKAVKELYLFGGSASDHSSIYYKYS